MMIKIKIIGHVKYNYTGRIISNVQYINTVTYSVLFGFASGRFTFSHTVSIFAAEVTQPFIRSFVICPRH